MGVARRRARIRSRAGRVGTELLAPFVAAAVYLNAIYGEWLDDDPLAITGNRDVACPRGVRGLFDGAAQLWTDDF